VLNMSRYNKVLFVSTGGTCRSLWAAAIFESVNTDRSITAEARGLVVLFKEPPNPKAVAIAKSKGISIENAASTPLTGEDFGEDVLILVMTDVLKKNIYDEFENAMNVYSIKEYTESAVDVEAAYGGELIEYGENFEYLEKLINIVIGKLKQDSPNNGGNME